MMTSRQLIVGVFVLAALVLVALPTSSTAVSAAQKGGGGGRGGGGNIALGSSQGRLDILEQAFTLTKEQKKTVKTLMDDAHKSAAPAREGLVRTRAAVAAAVQGNKSAAEIDAAVKSYAEQSAAMAGVEMKALADIMKVLDATQRANNAAISRVFFMMRGAFLDNKKWDDIPDGKMY
jgi:Spy/CpxP family protein refolding chaperone